MLRSFRMLLIIVVVAGLLVGCASAPPTVEPASELTPALELAPTSTEPAPQPTASPALSPTPPEPTEIADNLSYEQAVHLFDYSPDTPEVKEISVEEGEGYTAHDILYTAHDPKIGIVKGWTTAYLVRPTGEGSFAGILFLHQYGPINGNRKEFLEEAKLLAQQGVVSLLIDGYFPWSTRPKDAQSDRQGLIGQVIELRRALDFLLAQPGVDPQRIGYVGHNFGASFGGILSGVENRVQAYALMTGWGKLSDILLSANFGIASTVDLEAYRVKMSVVDPVLYIPHAAPANLLFQFALNDQYLFEPLPTEFFDAASEPKEMRWYAATHQLDEVAQQERLAWLAGQLSLPAVP